MSPCRSELRQLCDPNGVNENAFHHELSHPRKISWARVICPSADSPLDQDQEAQGAAPLNFVPLKGELHMPTDVAVSIAIITGVFVAFMAALAWATMYTRGVRVP